MPKAERDMALKETLKHVKKPDVDNLLKLYLDVLTTVAYEDDNCVSLGHAIKVYSAKPRVVIYITEQTNIVSLEESNPSMSIDL